MDKKISAPLRGPNSDNYNLLNEDDENKCYSCLMVPPLTEDSDIENCQKCFEKFKDNNSGFHPFLKHFRSYPSNHSRRLEIADLGHIILNFCENLYGSYFLLQKLESASQDQVTMIVDEILPVTLRVVGNRFGNSVITKILERASTTQRRLLVDKIFGSVLSLSLDKLSFKFVVKALEVVELQQKVQIVNELSGNHLGCLVDNCGIEVLTKCIQCVPDSYLRFIVTSIRGNIAYISCHRRGYAIVKALLDSCVDPENQNMLNEELLENVSLLGTSRFGISVLEAMLKANYENNLFQRNNMVLKFLAALDKDQRERFFAERTQ